MKTYNLNNNEFIYLDDLPLGTNDMLVKYGRKTQHLRINKSLDYSYVILEYYDGTFKTFDFFVTTIKKLYIDKKLISQFKEISEAYQNYRRFQNILGE